MREEIGFGRQCFYIWEEGFYSWQKKNAMNSDRRRCHVPFISRTIANQLLRAKNTP